MPRLRLLLIFDDCSLPAGHAGLREKANFDVVKVCQSWGEAEEELASQEPDVVVVFANPAGNASQELATRLQRSLPNFRCVVLVAAEQTTPLQTKLDSADTHRVLPTNAPFRDLCHAICDVAEDGLSDRERDVLRMIARGFTNKEIAGRLELSVKSVEKYKTRAHEKLGLRSRANAVTYAIARGWLVE